MITSPQHETLPARFFANARRLGSGIAHYYWAHGQWFPVGWATMAAVVRDLASGLIELGHRPSEPVAVVSATRREWTYIDLAVMSIGGVTVGLYPHLGADEYQRLLARSDAGICVVDGADHLARVLAVRDALPRLRTIVVMDASDLSPAAPGIVSCDELARMGRRAAHDIAARVALITPLDAATFLPTAGTTGPAQLAMMTHENLTRAMGAWAGLGLSSADIGYTGLPLAHATARSFEHLWLWLGMKTAYSSARADLVQDLMDMRPTVLFMLPRTLEDLASAVYDDMYSLTAGRKLLRWAGRIARHAVRQRYRGRGSSAGLEAQVRLSRRLVLNRLRACLGGRLRHLHVAGGAATCELLYALEVTGVRVTTGWAMAETCGVGSLTRFGQLGEDDIIAPIGRPVPGMELSLAADGELLVRGPTVFSGYCRDDRRTGAAFTSSGHLRTGDSARLGDGVYHITGRIADVIVTQSGARVAPRVLESLLCVDPRISQAVVLGHGRPYLVALVAVRASVHELFDDKTVQAMVEDIVTALNIELPQAEHIRQFRVLPYELGQSGDELGPTLEIRRDVVSRRFGYLIDEMY